MTSKPSPKIVILADDLTSAADGAGPFVRRGLTASVDRSHPLTFAADVLAVDMATRSMSVPTAVETVVECVASLIDARFLMKTVDSTLRGHVCAEIEAAAKASRRRHLVFAPAFPEAGRITRGGLQLVDGVPVAESPYSRDPVHPVQSSHLADFVPPSIPDALLLDAEMQEELDAKVAAVPHPEDVLWVGSPGLAISLSRLFGSDDVVPPLPKADGAVLVVVGSANAVSLEQAARAAGMNHVDVLRTPTKRGDAAATLADLTARASIALDTGRFGALLATGGETMGSILGAIGVQTFALTSDLEPGFPVATTHYRGRPLILGMKAGGFGDPDTLAYAAKRLTTSVEPSV